MPNEITRMSNDDDPREMMRMSGKIDPPEIFEAVNKLAETVNDPMPGIWDMLTKPGARNTAAMISEIKRSRIKVVNEYIRGLETQIALYVKAHENDFRIGTAAAYTARFEQVLPLLERASSDTQMTYIDILSKEIVTIDSYKNLPTDFIEDQKQLAQTRAKEGQSHAAKTFRSLVDEFSQLVKNMVADAKH